MSAALLCGMKAQRRYTCGAPAAYAMATDDTGRLACRQHMAQAADELGEVTGHSGVLIKMVAVNLDAKVGSK